MKNRVDMILEYWFGRVEKTVLPSENRSRIWFGGGSEVDEEVTQKFKGDLERAIAGEYTHWEDEPRSHLAFIVLLDQFSRHIYRNTEKAFSQDKHANDSCLSGLAKKHDHNLSLIERAFFYMPLMHSESIQDQAMCVQLFKMLVDLALPETRDVFDNFLKYAVLHYQAIEQYGRFPHRNQFLGRPSTESELKYLRENPAPFG